MYGLQKEPLLNNVLNLISLSDLAPTVEGGSASVTGTAVDADEPKEREEIVFLEIGTVTNMDRAFVRILESVDNDVFTEICFFEINAGVQFRKMKRKGRYLNYEIDYEFVQVDDMNPVASAFPITLKVLR